MNYIILSLLINLSSPAFACVDAIYTDLTCTEKLGTSDNFYPLGDVTFSPSKMLIKQDRDVIEIPIPSTRVVDGWSTSYYCKEEILVIEEEFMGSIASQDIKFHDSSFSYIGQALYEDLSCDDNGSCDSGGVKVRSINGACE